MDDVRESQGSDIGHDEKTVTFDSALALSTDTSYGNKSIGMKDCQIGLLVIKHDFR